MANTSFESSFLPQARKQEWTRPRQPGHGIFSSALLWVALWALWHPLLVQGSGMFKFSMEHSSLKAVGNPSCFKVSGRLTFQTLPTS